VRILFPASEVVPFSKTGGLADVAGALPLVLAERGHQVRVVTPLYRTVPRHDLRESGRTFTLEFPFGDVVVRTWEVSLHERATFVFLDVPELYDRAQLYGDSRGDYPDNARRFAVLSMAALTDAQAAGYEPDILHCHDWQTGLAPLALRRGYAQTFAHTKSVLTVHNLAYQGGFQKSALPELGIPWSDFSSGGVEFWDHLSMLKAGIVFSDAVTTVSPTYAKEISSPSDGMGLDGVLRAKNFGVVGIVNGIDTSEWNPATDVYLPARFSDGDVEGRSVCRSTLLEAVGLQPPSEGMPLFGVIGRMVEQKGADLLHAALPVFLEHGAAVVVLGSGAAKFEQGWKSLASRYPQRVGVRLGYDTGLAHLIEAGSDFFLMPSRFEPCGLNQMYSQRYGCVPVVHAVGGLVDTVQDVRSGEGTGITFRGATVEAVQGALQRAIELYQQKPTFLEVQRRGMRTDFSWNASAAKYEAVYRELLERG
jgi:starch synthase